MDEVDEKLTLRGEVGDDHNVEDVKHCDTNE